MEKWWNDEWTKVPEYTSGGVDFSPVVTRGEIYVEQGIRFESTYHRVRSFIDHVRRLKIQTAMTYAAGQYAER
jgi:hypothetical protein